MNESVLTQARRAHAAYLQKISSRQDVDGANVASIGADLPEHEKVLIGLKEKVRIRRERLDVILEIDGFESRGLVAVSRFGVPLRDRLEELDRLLAGIADGRLDPFELARERRERERAAVARVTAGRVDSGDTRGSANPPEGPRA